MAITSTSSSTSATSTSSLDVASIVSQLMTAENKPIDAIKTKITGQQLVISELGTIKSKVAALQDALGVFEDINTYGNMLAASDNTAVATATATGGAVPGTYRVVVSQAAQKSTYNITGLASATDTLSIDASTGFQITTGSGAGQVIYSSNGDKTVNGATTHSAITALGANPTATTLKDWINSLTSNTNVSASITQTTGNNYALVIAGKLEGAANDFSISGLTTGNHVINFSSPNAQVLLDSTNGFQMSIGGVTYKTAGAGANVQAITGTGAGQIVTVNDLAGWINDRSSANHLGITASVTGSDNSYQLVINQTGDTSSPLNLAGIVPYESISGYQQANGSDLINIDATSGFSVTVGGTVYNTKGTKTVGTTTTAIATLASISATPTINDLKNWINQVATSDVTASYVGSGSNWSLLIKSNDATKAITASGMTTALTRLDVSDAGFASANTLVNLDGDTGFTLTVNGHTFSTLGKKDNIINPAVATLGASATLTDLANWVTGLSGQNLSASVVNNAGTYSLQITQTGTPAADLSIGGLKPNALANGFNSANDQIASLLNGDVSAKTVNAIGDRVITINDSDVQTGATFSLSVNGTKYSYTALAGDTGANVAAGLKATLLADYPDNKSVSTYPAEVSRTQGAGHDETANITFSAMKAGDSVTVAGMTMTAKRDLNANEVAAAFNVLQDGYTAPTETTIIKNRVSDAVSGLATVQIQNVINPTSDGIYKLTYNDDTLTMTRYVNGTASGTSSIKLLTSGMSNPAAVPPTVLFNPNLNDVTTLNFGAYGSFDIKVTQAASSSETAGQIVNSIISATEGSPTSVAGTWTNVMGANWADQARINLGLSTTDTLKAVVTTKNGSSLRISNTTGLTAATGYGSLSDQQSGRTELGFTGTSADLDNALKTLQANSSDGLDQVEVFIVPSYISVYKNNASNEYDFLRMVTPASSLSWNSAKAAADASSFNGSNGYLGQFISQDEFNFMHDKLANSGLSGAWIGGIDVGHEGHYVWQDGPLAGVEFYVGEKYSNATLYPFSNPGSIQADASLIKGNSDIPESHTWNLNIVYNPSIATTPTSLQLPTSKAITFELKDPSNGATDTVTYTNNSGADQLMSDVLSRLNSYFSGTSLSVNTAGSYSIAGVNNSGEAGTFGMFSKFNFSYTANSTTGTLTFTSKNPGSVTDGAYASFQMKGINQYTNFPGGEPNNGGQSPSTPTQNWLDLWIANGYRYDDLQNNNIPAYVAQYSESFTDSQLDNIRRDLNLSAPGVIEVGNAAHNALGNNVLQYASYSGTFSGYQSAPSQASVNVKQGVNGLSTEQANVSFSALSSGQSVTIAGLTFTAGASGANAIQVASAFANLTNSATTGAGTTFGSYSGSLNGWSTGNNLGSTGVLFTSATPNTDVNDLVISGAPIIKTKQGVSSGSTETANVSFSALIAGQTLTLGGLTFTASTNGATANQVANAFANIANGTSSTALSAITNITNGGTFTNGTLQDWSSGANTNNTLTFTSATSNTDVLNLTVGNTPTITTTQGINGVSTEHADVHFSNLLAGQSLTLAGLTFTAGNGGANALQVASAFANLTKGTAAASLSGITNATNGGTFTSGTIENWTTTSNIGSTLTFSSATANANVTDLSPNDLPTITTTDGVSGPSTEYADVTFSALNAGQSITLAGLTFTAGSAGINAADLAGAFCNLVDGQSSWSINQNANLQTLKLANKGSFSSGSVGNWTTGSNTGSQLRFTSTTPNQNVVDLAAVGNSITLTSVVPGTDVANLLVGSSTRGSLTPSVQAPNFYTYVASDAGSNTKEQWTFNFQGLQAGNAIQIAERNGGSLTFTAAKNLTANQVAQAFANLSAGAAGSSENGIFSVSGAGLSDYTSSSANGSLVKFTSLTATDTHDLVAQVIGRSASSTTQANPIILNGAPYVTESAQYSFNAAGIKSGDSVTVGGLTFTANRALSNAELAAAFANLSDGADTGAGSAYGYYAGSLSGYQSGAVLANNEIAFVSTATKGQNPTDLTASALVKQLDLQGNALTLTALGAQLGLGDISLNKLSDFVLTVGDTAYHSKGVKVVGGTSTAISALTSSAANPTLTDLRDWINSVVPIADAQASIVQRGANYTLEVNGKNNTNHISMAGLDSSINLESNFPVTSQDKVNKNSTALAGTILGSGIGIGRYSQAQDAKLTIGGIQYQRSSNSINDIVPGLTINLMDGAGTANIKVTLGQDNSEKAITDLADAYNALIKAYNTMTANSANSKTPGTFATSPTTLSFIENIKRRFATGATYNIGTNNASGNPYIISLASLGLDYQLDGTLKYNSISYLTSQANGLREKFLKGLRIGYVSATDNLMSFVRSQSGPGGALAQEMTIENNSINTLNKEQDNLQTRINKIQDNYIAQYSGLNALLFQLNSTSTNLGNALTALNNMSASK